MEKKKLISLSLSLALLIGLINDNTLRSISRLKTHIDNYNKAEKKIKRQKYLEINPKIIEYNNYQIIIIDSILIKDIDNYKYFLPNEFNFFPENDDLGYKVEKIEQTIYPAVPIEQEDGRVEYYLPFGGELIGTDAVITVYKPISKKEQEEVINSYLEEAKLTLKGF